MPISVERAVQREIDDSFLPNEFDIEIYTNTYGVECINVRFDNPWSIDSLGATAGLSKCPDERLLAEDIIGSFEQSVIEEQDNIIRYEDGAFMINTFENTMIVTCLVCEEGSNVRKIDSLGYDRSMIIGLLNISCSCVPDRSTESFKW